jgi:hypothetical protein
MIIYLADTDSWRHHFHPNAPTNPNNGGVIGFYTGYLYTNSNFGLQIFQDLKVAMYIDVDTLFETGMATFFDIEGMLGMDKFYGAGDVKIFTYVKP